MRILFLTQIIPYPPDAGPRVKTWHVLRYLAAQGHEVTLVSFVRPEEEQYVPVLRELCAAVHTVPIRRSRLADVGYWLRSHLSGRPFLIERDDLSAMRRLLAGLAAQERFDAVHADQLGMAQFALPFKNGASDSPVLVFDAHNAVWTIIERMRLNAPWMLRIPAAVEARRVKQYEGWIVRQFDHTLAVAEPDRRALVDALQSTALNGGINPKSRPIHVIPIAVDTQALQPARRKAGSKNIVTLGTLHYPPNADGIRWFMKEVFPLVLEQEPDATLTVIGKNPPEDFARLAAQHAGRIEITGYVPDLDPYMDQAALMVVAVRAGGGMRVRILEAFARAMPVVTTTVGLEGIEALPGRDVLVADAPEAFARNVVRLLRDPQLQRRLAENGRRLAEEKYDWQVILSKMDAVYQAASELQVGAGIEV